jgi:hypothetical protein
MTIRQIGKTLLLRSARAFHDAGRNIVFVRHSTRHTAEFLTSLSDELREIAFPDGPGGDRIALLNLLEPMHDGIVSAHLRLPGCRQVYSTSSE